jgi:hypothetical protein
MKNQTQLIYCVSGSMVLGIEPMKGKIGKKRQIIVALCLPGDDHHRVHRLSRARRQAGMIAD